MNQTAKCQGPPVLLFQARHVPEEAAAVATPVPNAWLYFAESSATTAYIRFIISKGTLVPTASPFADAGVIQLQRQRLASAAKRPRHDESDAIRAPPGVLEPEPSEQVWRTSPTCTPPPWMLSRLLPPGMVMPTLTVSSTGRLGRARRGKQ